MNIDNIELHNFFLDEKIKNTIINNGTFYKLHYSNHILSLSNILIHIDINKYKIIKNYNRYKVIFKKEEYNHIINKICLLEHVILHNLFDNSNTNKIANLNITTLLTSGYFKLSRYPRENETIALKISGIWETDSNYGLTYKFILISK